MAQQTYYEVLQVPRTATPDEIRKAFRKRAAECHPDRVMQLSPERQEEARQRMTLVNEAHEVLKNPQQRAEYNEYLDLLEKKRTEGGAAPRAPGSSEAVAQGDGSAPAPAPASSGEEKPASTISRALAAGESGLTALKQKAAGSSVATGASAPLAPPEPERVRRFQTRPAKPPPQPTHEQLVAWLETAVREIQRLVRDSAPAATWREAPAKGFDLCLDGTEQSHRYLVYVTTCEILSDDTLNRFVRDLDEALASTGSLQKRHVLLLVLCIQVKNVPSMEARLRQENLEALGTLVKRRATTRMLAFLHVPSGRLHAPFLACTRPDLRALRELQALY